jgi:hypothetical protein
LKIDWDEVATAMSLKNEASARARLGQLKNKYALRTNEDLAGQSDQTRNLPPATAGRKRKSEVMANDTGAKNNHTAKRSKGGAEPQPTKAKGKVTPKAKPRRLHFGLDTGMVADFKICWEQGCQLHRVLADHSAQDTLHMYISSTSHPHSFSYPSIYIIIIIRTMPAIKIAVVEWGQTL